MKRALTDPRILSGIGNAHSDEILLAARLSPVKRTRQLSEEEVGRLFESTRRSLQEWTERLRTEAGDEFPKKVTAFHPAMAATASTANPAPSAARQFRGLSTPSARPTTARRARQGGSCWRTGRSPDC